MEAGAEELYLLRVTDSALAEKIRALLSEEKNLEGLLQLTFDDPASRTGKLTFQGLAYDATLLDLPTVVESYKTYDDTNLVKTGDVGQMLLIGPPPDPSQTESTDGVTLPMRNARKRHFRTLPEVDPQLVRRVEQDLHDICSYRVPAGMEFEDIEEEYVVEGGKGSWRQVASTDK